jgi:hypothetical protein
MALDSLRRMFMMGAQGRRSQRVVISVPVRVFGVDYRGKDFTEDAVTVVVNLHGAKLRMNRQLIPDSEIRVVSPTGQDSVFRVVCEVQGPEARVTDWGVENLEPGKNFWGVEIPESAPVDAIKAQVTLECATCSARESLAADEQTLALLRQKGGAERTCPACQATGLWKLLPFNTV